MREWSCYEKVAWTVAYNKNDSIITICGQNTDWSSLFSIVRTIQTCYMAILLECSVCFLTGVAFNERATMDDCKRLHKLFYQLEGSNLVNQKSTNLKVVPL